MTGRPAPIRRALLAVILALAAGAALADELAGRVVAIAGGDTLTVLDAGHQEHRIRLAGIDAPEKRQAFGQAAKRGLSDLAYGRAVLVRWDKRDRYGRIVGVVLVDGADAGLAQVRAGLAWHYTKYAREQTPEDRQAYAQAEADARARHRGLWSDPAPVAPWDWRVASRTAGVR
ncbi:MAG: thermonuclease family protein [Zavarzinia sp.]|nr:thermonuclease family protein [Zavarzinia sp.]